ncbi:MAG TPA: DNA polymerase III subunit delta [Candidatus Moranbacteria bacterium]|nr:DNA polymerase III subunit delta [Candidatus Moranbacteria bacterium]
MLIFLYGKDGYRAQEKIRSIKQKFLEKSSGSDLSSFDFGEISSAQPLSKALSSQGLFSPKRLILVSGALSCPTALQKEILTELTKHPLLPADNDTVLIFWENSDPKKNLSLFKFLLKNAKNEQLAPLAGMKLEKWALSFLAKEFPSSQIDRQALSEVLATTGGDLYRLDAELSKLALYKKGSTITPEDVKLMLSQKPLSTVFEAIEALTLGNSAASLKLLHEQLSLGQDPLYLLSMYVYQLRTLLKVKSALAEGIFDSMSIARYAQIHPFVAQKSIPRLRAMPGGKLEGLYLRLAELDINAKTGGKDPVLALDELLCAN